MADNWETISAELTSNVNSIENNIINYSLNTKGNINDYFIIDYLSANNQTSTFNLFNDFVNKTQLLFYKPYSLNWFKQVTQVVSDYWTNDLCGLTYLKNGDGGLDGSLTSIITSDIDTPATHDAYVRYVTLSSMLSAKSNYDIDYDNCESYQFMISSLGRVSYLISGSSIPDNFDTKNPETYISSFTNNINNGGGRTENVKRDFTKSYVISSIKLDKDSYVSFINFAKNVSEGTFVEIIKLPPKYNIYDINCSLSDPTLTSSYLIYIDDNYSITGTLGSTNCVQNAGHIDDNDNKFVFYKYLLPADTEISVGIGYLVPNSDYTQYLRTFVNIYPILSDPQSIRDNLSVFNQ